MKRILLAVIITTAISCNAFSQEPIQKDYVIITYEYRHKPNFEGTYTYYWIIPQDSIAKYKSTLFPLAVNLYSKNDLVDCCSGKETGALSEVDRFPIAEFNSEDKNNELQLKTILKHRKRLMTLTQKWEMGWSETVSVFATPVSGKFCSSNLGEHVQQRFGYKGKVYVPYSSFTFLDGFWDSDKGKYLIHQNLLEGKYNQFDHDD
jgi:hypothetical protein